MPYIENSKYRAPYLVFKNPHVSTIYVGRVKKFAPPLYERERLELEDGDFLDIDFCLKNRNRAVILCHGLEGGSKRTYNNSCATFFLKEDYSVFAWNNRSCSGEMNRTPKLYHHGAIDDFQKMVDYVLGKNFDEIYLIGFSMGGAQLMNYLGSFEIDPRIKAAVAVSTPVNLKSSAEKLKKRMNAIYLKNFIRKIRKKLIIKEAQFPDVLDWSKLKSLKTFDEVDDFFTAPVHGYMGKEDYYLRASPDHVMKAIRTPILILNAWDDSFLGSECYPIEFAKKSSIVFLETPNFGGHCAFPMKNSKYSYAEIRGLEFFQKINMP